MCGVPVPFILLLIRRRGVVGRVPAFQPGGPCSIPGGVRNFNFCLGIGSVSFVCVLSCFVFGGGPDIVLTTLSGRPALVYLSSVLVQKLLLLLQSSDTRAFGSGQVSWVRFFRGFSSPVRQMSGSFRPQDPRISFGHHYHHHLSFITGANDLRC